MLNHELWVNHIQQDTGHAITSAFLTHEVLQRVAHQLLLQGFNQRHLNRLSLILCLAVGAEPLRQDGTILMREKQFAFLFTTLESSFKERECWWYDQALCSLPSLRLYLSHRWVLAEVKVTTEIAMVADNFR